MTELPRLATAVNEGCDVRILRTVAMPGVALAIWHRGQTEKQQIWLDGLPPERLPRMRGTLHSGQIREAVALALERAGTPGSPHGHRLLDDIEAMVATAAMLLASPLVQVRLDVSEDQSCPRWHLDAVCARLLCTLRGHGTEFGPARPDGTPSSIHALPTGAVGVFRGLLWPGRELSGIVHRSPPCVPGKTRLLLVVDPVDDAGVC
jgi:hypothetical protein